MSLVRSLVEAYRGWRQHLANRATYKRELLKAVSKGSLNDQDVQGLNALTTSLALTPRDTQRYAIKAYSTAFEVVRREGSASPQEETALDRIQEYLQLPSSRIAGKRAELEHLRLLGEIQAGRLPTTTVIGLVLQKGEVAHWCEPAEILEERVVNRRFVGGSQGVSIRIAKGVSYRVGSFRGHTIVDRATIPVSRGHFVVTSKRLVFLGDKKGFTCRYDKVLDIQLMKDGVRVSDSAGKPHLFRFSSTRNVDVIAGIVSHAINAFAA